MTQRTNEQSNKQTARTVDTDDIPRSGADFVRTAPLHTLPFHPPANPTQRRVWLAEKDALDRPRFNLSYCWRISGRFEPEAFHGALAAVVARHEALRTTFTLIEGDVLRVEHERLPPQFTFIDDVPTAEITAY